MHQFSVCACAGLNGEVTIPGDKSISHRAVMLASIADGTTEITGFLFGADNIATLEAMQHLGVAVTMDKTKGQVTIRGKGRLGLTDAKRPLEMGNSGTAMRLLTGLLAGQAFKSTLIGDASLSRRPMARVVDPLKKMGAKIKLTAQGTAPIEIDGGHTLKGIEYVLPMASAQVKSALLLAGIYAKGDTMLTEPSITRDHTERMLRAFGYPVESVGQCVRLTGGQSLRATSLQVPSDISSAAFFMVAASIVPGSHVILKNVGINPTRVGIIHLLRAMGGKLTLFNERTLGDEPVADIEIISTKLHGITIPEDQVPLAIDEMPILMIAAACASGETRLSGAEELRVKETDRIAAMARGLTTLGIHCQPTADGIIIQGGQLHGGNIQSDEDHRIAMAFAVAGCVAKETVTIQHCRNVQTSFPNFVELARSLGMNIHVT
ncbi:MAG: 3-phosphoshikimate 1-carboxyvinyltransferase [Coxiella sp. RIFCSPHIGHO2_12_FULL_42_15]|nr:MAG: 3-phosphoshikimate 1-carboxyvinyltransferase [Coxiella sp. RIFCSPHIGHO2_12_FULL_42_15]